MAHREDGLSFKRYPVCYCSHRAIDALLGLRAAHRFEASEIVEIEARIRATQARILENHRPMTASSARFSLEFALACAVQHGSVSLAHLTDAEVRAPAMQALMGKVRVATTEQRDPLLPGYAPHDEGKVTHAVRTSELSQLPPAGKGHRARAKGRVPALTAQPAS